MAPDDNLEATSPRTRRRRQFQDEETRRRVAEHYAKAAGFGRAADMREACLRLLPRPEPPGPPMVAFHAQFQDEETRRRVAEHYAKAAGFGRAADMREACLRLLPRPEPPGPPMVAFHARGPWHPLAGAVVTFAGAREPAGLLRGMVARPDGRLEVQVELYSGAER